MPAAVPLIGALAGYATATELGISTIVGLGALNAGIGLTAGAGIFLGSAAAGLAGFVVSTAINAIGSRAFAPGKSNPGSNLTSDPQARATMINSTVETHKIIYGEAKVSGPVVYT